MKKRRSYKSECEQLGVQLAGCMTAALGWNQKKPAKRGDYGWSPAYQDVLNLRRNFDRLNQSNRRAA